MATETVQPTIIQFDSGEGLASPDGEGLHWLGRHGRIGGVFLLAGFALPLLKSSFLLGGTICIWPWDLLRTGDPTVVISMAPCEPSWRWSLWGFLPLLGAAGAWGALRSAAAGRRSLAMLGSGLGTILLLQYGFQQELPLYGLYFVGPSMQYQLLVTGAILAATLVSGANHLRRTFAVHPLPRILSGIGGALILAAAGLVTIAGDKETELPLVLTALLVAVWGAAGLASAFRPIPGERHLALLSWGARLILIALPLGVSIQRRFQQNPLVEYVLEGGGGTGPFLLSLLKFFLIFYGCLILFSTGLTGSLSGRLSRSFMKEEER